jgi:hypothetical protein
MKTQNAIITSVDLSIEDHGSLTACVFLEFDGGGQGFVFRVMEIAGVEHWDKLVGKAIRVRHDVKGESILGATIHSIGHIVKNDWFNPEEEFKALDK